MKQELLRMQMLAGIITESQYKAKLNEASNTMFNDRNKALGILFRKRTPEDLYDDDYEYLWIHENVVKFCEFLGYGEESLDVAGEFTDFAYPGTEDDYESLGNPNVPIEGITIGMYRKVIEDFYEKPEDESLLNEDIFNDEDKALGTLFYPNEDEEGTYMYDDNAVVNLVKSMGYEDYEEVAKEFTHYFSPGDEDEMRIFRAQENNPKLQPTDLTIGMYKKNIEKEFKK